MAQRLKHLTGQQLAQCDQATVEYPWTPDKNKAYAIFSLGVQFIKTATQKQFQEVRIVIQTNPFKFADYYVPLDLFNSLKNHTYYETIVYEPKNVVD